MTVPELLAPAGDPEKLETALDYGADAVYAGVERFGLRAQAGNFSLPELARARALVRGRGKKLYLTLNALLRPEDLPSFATLLEELRPLDLDAYIVSDPGALALVRQVDPGRPLHLSTQASTSNPAAARFWSQAGVGRINLARELSLEDIRAVHAAVPEVELEVFVHGAMCVAWSGRCLLSAALTGRSANRGVCTHPCRWKYALVEETRPGEFFPLEEDGRGTYLLNSRDLCLVEHIPELARAGAASLKIEGRMKSCYYVAAVTRVYRAALDRYRDDPQGWRCDPAWIEELDKVSHRPYDRGFLFGGKDPLVHPGDARYRRTCDFVGVVAETRGDGLALVEVRNRFREGEALEIIGPAMRQARFEVREMRREDGAPADVVHANARVLLPLPAGARAGDLVRRPVRGDE